MSSESVRKYATCRSSRSESIVATAHIVEQHPTDGLGRSARSSPGYSHRSSTYCREWENIRKSVLLESVELHETGRETYPGQRRKSLMTVQRQYLVDRLDGSWRIYYWRLEVIVSDRFSWWLCTHLNCPLRLAVICGLYWVQSTNWLKDPSSLLEELKVMTPRKESFGIEYVWSMSARSSVSAASCRYMWCLSSSVPLQSPECQFKARGVSQKSTKWRSWKKNRKNHIFNDTKRKKRHVFRAVESSSTISFATSLVATMTNWRISYYSDAESLYLSLSSHACFITRDIDNNSRGSVVQKTDLSYDSLQEMTHDQNQYACLPFWRRSCTDSRLVLESKRSDDCTIDDRKSVRKYDCPFILLEWRRQLLSLSQS